MTEAELQHAVEDLADELNIWWHHEPDSRRSRSGWVDLVLLGQNGALFVELKGSGQVRTWKQLLVAGLLATQKIPYRLWTVRDWHDGTIQAELNAIR